MHPESYKIVEDFAAEFIKGENLRICDVGSLDINGTYRPIFRDRHHYMGIDIRPGPNVDITVQPYAYPFDDSYFDVIVSGQTMEHIEDIYAWMDEVARVAKNLVCIIVPWQWGPHREPVDCWRILPDGMRFLFDRSGLEVIKIWTDQSSCIGISRKKGGKSGSK